MSKRELRLENKLRKRQAELRLLGENSVVAERQQRQQRLLMNGLVDVQVASTATDPGTVGVFNGACATSTAVDESSAVDLAQECELAGRQLKEQRSRSGTDQQRPQLRLNLRKLHGRYLNGTDVQSLLLYTVLGGEAPVKPRWCFMIHKRRVTHAVVVVIECAFPLDNEIACASFPFIERYFGDRVLMETSRRRFYADLDAVAVSAREQLRQRMRTDGDPLKKENRTQSQQFTTSTCRTELILSVDEMMEAGYPFPFEAIGSADDTGVTLSRDLYGKLSKSSRIFAVDCEMCLTHPHSRSELTRISIVDEQERIVLDELVLPENRISDYLTRFSGITKPLLKDCRTRLEEIQKALKYILPADAILVGHSFNFDLTALKMCHPSVFSYVIDISLLFNLSGTRQLKSSLCTMAHIFLKNEIQQSAAGHCSVEDALATMKLLKLKMSHGYQFGNVELGWNYEAYIASHSIERTRDRGKKADQELCGHSPTLSHFASRNTTEYDEDSSPAAKRSRIEADEGVIVAQSSTDATATPPAHSKQLLCSDCQRQLSRACRTGDCVCHSLGRTRPYDGETTAAKNQQRCLQCFLRRPNRTPSPKDAGGALDWKLALRAEKPAHSRRSLAETLEKYSRRLLYALNSDDTPSVQRSNCTRVTAATDVERVQKFREQMLEHELNLLQLTVEDAAAVTTTQVEELLTKTVFSTPKHSLVTVVLLSDSACYFAAKVKS